jgi:hypothetical protein
MMVMMTLLRCSLHVPARMMHAAPAACAESHITLRA